MQELLLDAVTRVSRDQQITMQSVDELFRYSCWRMLRGGGN
jgi:hypothetical protein